MSAASRHGSSNAPIRIVRAICPSGGTQGPNGRQLIFAVGRIDAQHPGLLGESRQRLARAEPGVQRRRRIVRGRIARQNPAVDVCQRDFAGLQFGARFENFAQQVGGRLAWVCGERLIEAHREDRSAKIDLARRSLDRTVAFGADMADRRNRQENQKQKSDGGNQIAKPRLESQ